MPLVTWTTVVNCTVSGVNDLTKTSGGAAWNAGAVSVASLASGDGYVEVTVSEKTTSRMFSLSNGDTDQNYTDLDFAIYFLKTSGGRLQVWEFGVQIGDHGALVTGDVIRIGVESGSVVYRKNGTLLYTSLVSPTYPLLVDTAFLDEGGTITGATTDFGADLATVVTGDASLAGALTSIGQIDAAISAAADLTGSLTTAIRMMGSMSADAALQATFPEAEVTFTGTASLTGNLTTEITFALAAGLSGSALLRGSITPPPDVGTMTTVNSSYGVVVSP